MRLLRVVRRKAGAFRSIQLRSQEAWRCTQIMLLEWRRKM